MVRARASPMQPVPTRIPARLRPLRGVRAVAFDVYGLQPDLIVTSLAQLPPLLG